MLAPLLNIGWTPPPRHYTSTGEILDPKDPRYNGPGVLIDAPGPEAVTGIRAVPRRELQTDDVRNEAALVTVAGIAWVLAGLVKPKV